MKKKARPLHSTLVEFSAVQRNCRQLAGVKQKYEIFLISWYASEHLGRFSSCLPTFAPPGGCCCSNSSCCLQHSLSNIFICRWKEAAADLLSLLLLLLPRPGLGRNNNHNISRKCICCCRCTKYRGISHLWLPSTGSLYVEYEVYALHCIHCIHRPEAARRTDFSPSPHPHVFYCCPVSISLLRSGQWMSVPDSLSSERGQCRGLEPSKWCTIGFIPPRTFLSGSIFRGTSLPDNFGNLISTNSCKACC